MKQLILIIIVLFSLGSCVPAKKYKDLLTENHKCNEELTHYKNSSLDYEGQAKNLQTLYNQTQQSLELLKTDTTELGNKHRLLLAQIDKLITEQEAMEKAFDKLRVTGAREVAQLQADLESKNIELQRKEDALILLEADLKTKEQLLSEREQRVNELEELIKRKDETTKQLKAKVAKALKGFENQGITVLQENGKVYVSMAAKLLFASGSTKVEPNGQQAIIELAKVLEKEPELEIVVEGHTDTDKITSSIHPTSNWELSVLRATSVVEIMLGNSMMNPAQIMASGRSEFHPVDPIEKAKNRRIEIIISPNLNELYEIISND